MKSARRRPRATHWEARISTSSVARTRERAGTAIPRTKRVRGGVSAVALSGDFMYITIPQAGTRAVHFWLTGRRSREGRVIRSGASRRKQERSVEEKHSTSVKRQTVRGR